MSKKRAIVAYENLTADQKKKLSREFPDGFQGQLTEIKKPTGEILDALIWETEEVIYLVKMSKALSIMLDDDDDDDYNSYDDDEVDEVELDEETE